MGRGGKWKPVLDGRLRASALKATYSIADSLRKRAVKEASLARGTAGVALLFGYVAEARSSPNDQGIAVKFLDKAADALAATRMGPFFFSGFTGVAWANAHLERRLLNPDGEDANEAVDQVLKVHLSLSPWREDYDVVSGLVGYGVYALERLPRQTAADCLELVVDRLDEIAEHTAQGVTWHTAPKLLPETVHKDFPNGYYNLGLAHGVPGVIALLGKICATRDERLQTGRAKAELLLKGAVAWLLAQQPADRAQSFPYWAGPGISATPGRVAWCYGDLGIAVALLGAARCVNERAWEREASKIGRRIAGRPAEQSGVVDCGLCHGAAGVGHLFNRLFQATGETRFATAARFWFERTLEMRRPNQGIAGFAALMPDPERPGKKRWIAAPGILEGAAGVALALLAAATPIKPEWDRMLLASIPPRCLPSTA
jgi:lantibiotic modifying enzyme